MPGRQALQRPGRLHDGDLHVEHVSKPDLHGRNQERLGNRRRLWRPDVSDVSRRLELQLEHRLLDQRLLPELVLRSERLHGTGPHVRLGYRHMRQPANVSQLQ